MIVDYASDDEDDVMSSPFAHVVSAQTPPITSVPPIDDESSPLFFFYDDAKRSSTSVPAVASPVMPEQPPQVPDDSEAYLTVEDLRAKAAKRQAELSPQPPRPSKPVPPSESTVTPDQAPKLTTKPKSKPSSPHPSPTPLVCEEVLNEWESTPEDDVTCLSERWSLSEDETHKPPKFPSHIWKYVEDAQRPHVIERWSRYPPERLDVILKTLASPKAYNICEERPNQKPYIVAQLYANIHAIFHVDEEFPERISGYTMRILTTTEVPQVVRKQQVYSALQQRFLEPKAQQLLRRGYCQNSESSYRARLQLVEYVDRVRAFMEKHGENAQEAMRRPEYADLVCTFFRVTCDLRLLNSVTVPDMHPMPRVLDILDAFASDSHFSAFDLQDGFWCIMLHMADRHKTAFATHNMLLEWCVNPQGSKNGAVVFARVIQNIMRNRPKNLEVYQDDLFPHGKTILQLLDAQQYMFDALSARNVTVKLSKMKLNYPRIKCLGHIVTSRGRCPDPDSIQAILDIDIPQNVDDLMRFNGLVTFQREYIPGLSDVNAPLYDLLQKKFIAAEDWKDEVHGVAFRKVKHLLISSPFLQAPDPSRPFRIHVDGCLSGRGMGAVLLQQDRDWVPPPGKTIADAPWRPVAYWSKKLTDPERDKYSATMVEAHALHDAIMHWAHYLQNGLSFSVIVDHQALVYLLTTPITSTNQKLLRMCNSLSGFFFSVLYKKGGKHLDADAMSRLFRYEENLHLDEPNSAADTVKESDIRSIRRWMSLDKEFLESAAPDDVDLMMPPDKAGYIIDEKGNEADVQADAAFVMSFQPDTDPETPADHTVPRSIYCPEPLEQPLLVLPCCLKSFQPDDEEFNPTHLYIENALTGESSFVSLPANTAVENVRRSPRARNIVGRQDDDFVYEPVKRKTNSRGKEKNVTFKETIETPELIAPTAKELRAQATRQRRENIIERNRQEAAARLQRRADRAEAARVRKEEKASATKELRAQRREAKKAARRQQLIASLSPRLRERMARMEGPPTVAGLPTPFDRTPETPEQEEERLAGELRARAKEYLIGRQFQHPISEKLYEITYVYYDVTAKKIAAYRRTCDSVVDSGDRFPYEVEGPRGIEVLVKIWEECAGINENVPRWPKSDQELRTAQHGDAEIRQIIEECEKAGDMVRRKNRRLIVPRRPDGSPGALRVYSEIHTDDPDEQASESLAHQDILVLPKALRPLCMRFYHEGLGHPGNQRMMKSIAQRYWWPGITTDVEAYCKACRQCKLRKADNNSARLPILRYPRSQRPFELVHIDLTGPFPKSNGYEYILVIKCALTQWIELVPLCSKEAREVAHALFTHVYCRHGAVTTYVSDRGSEFCNTVSKAVDHLLQQHHITTTPYHPEANGKVENQNRTLKDMLSCYCHDNQADWSVYLQLVAHAYRTTINSATGYSPFRALFGREARQPSETWIQDFALHMTVDVDEYARHLALALHYTWNEIASRVSEKNAKLDQRFARPDMQRIHGDHKPARTERPFKEYAPGDQFYLRTLPSRFYIDDGSNKHRLSSKLQRRYTGPHVVQSVINPVTYRAIVNGKIRVVHASKMKRDQPAPAIIREIPDYHEDDESAPVEHPHEPNLVPAQPADRNPIDDYDDQDEESDDELDNANYYRQWLQWIDSLPRQRPVDDHEYPHEADEPEPHEAECSLLSLNPSALS